MVVQVFATHAAGEVLHLGFLLLFKILLEKGRLVTPTLVYEKNARVSKPLETNQRGC